MVWRRTNLFLFRIIVLLYRYKRQSYMLRFDTETDRELCTTIKN